MLKLSHLKQSGLAFWWLVVGVIAIDRVTKVWVLQHLLFSGPQVIFPFFNLTLAFNTGAAFSFLNEASGWQHFVFGGLAFIVSVILVRMLIASRRQAYFYNVALCLILAGAIGNAWDRIQYQYVIDFLDFHLGTWHFAIFNIADSAICIGAAMLAWTWYRSRHHKE